MNGKAKIGVLKSPTWNLVLDSWILFGSCDLGSWFLAGDEVDDSVAQLAVENQREERALDFQGPESEAIRDL